MTVVGPELKSQAGRDPSPEEEVRRERQWEEEGTVARDRASWCEGAARTYPEDSSWSETTTVVAVFIEHKPTLNT